MAKLPPGDRYIFTGPGQVPEEVNAQGQVIAIGITGPGGVPINTSGSKTSPASSTGSSPVSTPASTSPAGGSGGSGSGAASLFGITLPGLGFITESFITFETILTDVMQPSFWFRIGAFLAGIPILLIGLWCLMKAADNAPLSPHMPSVMPIPV